MHLYTIKRPYDTREDSFCHCVQFRSSNVSKLVTITAKKQLNLNIMENEYDNFLNVKII